VGEGNELVPSARLKSDRPSGRTNDRPTRLLQADLHRIARFTRQPRTTRWFPVWGVNSAPAVPVGTRTRRRCRAAGGDCQQCTWGV